MDVSRIIQEIDSQIAKLQQAKALLTGSTHVAKPGRGRPKGSKNAPKTAGKRTRTLSAEGRKRIADAMKRRWAERRKTAAKYRPVRTSQQRERSPKRLPFFAGEQT